jgi:hypothetical protein
VPPSAEGQEHHPVSVGFLLPRSDRQESLHRFQTRLVFSSRGMEMHQLVQGPHGQVSGLLLPPQDPLVEERCTADGEILQELPVVEFHRLAQHVGVALGKNGEPDYGAFLLCPTANACDLSHKLNRIHPVRRPSIERYGIALNDQERSCSTAKMPESSAQA